MHNKFTLDELHEALADPDTLVESTVCSETGTHECRIKGVFIGRYPHGDIWRPGLVSITNTFTRVPRLEPLKPIKIDYDYAHNAIKHEKFINWVRARTGRRKINVAQSGYTSEDLWLDATFEMRQGDSKTRDKFHEMGLQA